jgi:phosphohistidine swiveling domain-containing protein
LLARVARELAGRLADRGALADPFLVRHCTVDELIAITDGAAAPADLAARSERRPAAPLPPVFRLAANGDVVPKAGREPTDGVPAGGGRATGVVRHVDDGEHIDHVDEDDAVLVVTHLDPALAVLLPQVIGLVAETGSPLSHLAILAREMHVPTVVAIADARERFPEGTRVMIDGVTGEVAALPDAEEVVS